MSAEINFLARTHRFAQIKAIASAALLAASVAPLALIAAAGPAWAATYNASNTAELQAAIANVNAGSGGDTINITGDITLSAELTAITKGLTIEGNGYTISGNDTYRVFFIAAPSGSDVTISDMTIADGYAKGGNGGGGGGGMGAGGAIFAMSGDVSLTGVSFSGNVAQGGNGRNGAYGGGGGMGGDGGTGTGFGYAGGGGGIGVDADGGNNVTAGGAGVLSGSGGGNGSGTGGGTNAGGGGGGSNAGGGGGVGGGAAGGSAGGAGGFGGGGGGAGNNPAGNGGFGGGGGAGYIGSSHGGNGGFGGGGGASTTRGAGGFGGGVGGSSGAAGGGGGMGAGGSIFVCTSLVSSSCSATLTITNTATNTMDGSVIGGGAGGGGAGAGSALGGSMFVTGAAVNVSAASGTTTTISNQIYGYNDNGLALSGGGTIALASANNSFNGITVSDAGTTVAAGAPGSLGSGTIHFGDGTGVSFLTGGTYTNNATVTGDPIFDTNGNTVTYAGQITDGTGPGDVEVTGGGTLILTHGGNSYSGGTVVRDGSTLQVAIDAAMGAVTGGLALGDATSHGTFAATGTFSSARDITLGAGGGSIATSSGQTLTLTGVISGGQLTLSGPGTTVLTGTNTYSGGTTISAGTLQIGDGGASGSILGDVVNDTTLAFKRSDTYTFGGDISGTGSVRQNGSGTTVLTGAHTYTGATTVSAGTLQGGVAGGFSSRSAFSVASGGMIDLGGFDQEIGSLSGSGGVTNSGTSNARLTTGRDDTSTAFSGTITDGPDATTALNKIGFGTLKLTGDNTYSGGTTISAGTLQIGDGGASGSILGDVVNNTTLAFNRSDTYTFNGDISGAGTVQQIGTGTLILTGTKTHTGNTIINQGTLQLGNAGTTGSVDGLVSLATAATFEVVNADTSGITRISNAGTTNFRNDTSAGSAEITSHLSLNFHDISTAGGATITNYSGNVIFSDASNAGNATLINNSNGSLTFNDTSTAGSADITNESSATLAFDGSSQGGNSIITNRGNLLFNGGSAAEGAHITNDDSTTFVDNASAGSADITNNADLQFQGTSTADSATITTKSGSLLTFLDNSTAASATITTEAGSATRFFDNSNGGNGRFITDADGMFDISSLTAAGMTAGSIEGAGEYFLGSKELTVGGNNRSTTVSGVIADGGLNGGDGGSLVKVGTGTLTLSGNNTYTGGTTISGGTLVVSSDANLGDASGGLTFNGGTLKLGASFDLASTRDFTLAAGGGTIDTDGFDTVVSQDIFGVAGLDKRGAGTLTLAGNNTYAGATTVSGGTLLVNGSIASSSAVTVDAGATIGGTGTLADTVVNGTLSAGNSPGTLTIDGNLTLGATSVSLFELDAPGTVGGVANDLVHVTGDLILDGTLETPGAVSGYYRLFNVDGTISGNYTSVPTDATVQTAVPNQVNLFIQNGDQIVQFWDGADATGNGSVDGGAGTWSTAGTNWTGAPGSATFNDQWHGDVGVFSGTGGTVTVSGPVAFEGIQFATDGYVITGGDLTMSGDSEGNTSASFVTVNGGATAEIASALTGAAGIGLDKFGNGTLVLSGVNTYTGTTTIEAGTLALSGSGSIADSSVVAVNDGIFDISGATLPFVAIKTLEGTSGGSVQLGTKGFVVTDGSTEFAGGIEGAGGLEIAGGTQTLSGVNTYTNATQIDAGATLALKDGGSIEDSSFVGLLGSGTLDISQTTDGASVAGLSSMTGAGTVALGSKTLIITEGSLFGGSIEDGGIGGGTGGSLMIASGASQELSGVNTFTGTTTIEDSGTLGLTGDGSLSASSGIATDGTFDVSGITTGLGPVIQSLTGSGKVYLGDRDLHITAANGTFSGVISDCGLAGNNCFSGSTGGTLVLDGGTLTLTGVNTYTGGTVVGGIAGPPSAFLVVTNNDAVGTGSVLLNDGGVFQAGEDGLEFDNSFRVSVGFGTVDTNGYTTTISGVIADANDPGTLHKAGAGTLILTNDNTYGDGTVIEAGTLQLGDGGTSGSIVGNVSVGGILAFDRSDTYSFAGAISDDGANTGQVVQQGAGTLVLAGTNSYSGGTVAKRGTLSFASNKAAGSGAITAQGSTIDYADGVTIANGIIVDSYTTELQVLSGTATQAGDISETNGPRPLVKTGAGTLVLSGDNSYTGQTTVSEGTLCAGTADAFSSGSAFVVSAGATLDLEGFDHAAAGLSGAGAVALGSGDLTVDQAGDTEFAGVISGGGSFSKDGAGKLMLSGVSIYTGQTFVNGGVLSVNGDISSSSLLMVGSDGTIGGSGLLPSVQVNGGTLAPGNSIGTVTIAGDLVFGAGSTYAVETSTTAADRTDVRGTADLSGGTVVVSYAPGTYVTKSYTILNATGGLGGTEFKDLDAAKLPGLETSLTYDGSSVHLKTEVKHTDPGCTSDCEPDLGDLNRNQKAVAESILDYFDRIGKLPAEFVTLAADGLTQVSGEIAAGAISAGIESADQFMGALDAQGRAGSGGGSTGAPVAYAEEGGAAGDNVFAPLGKSAGHDARQVDAAFANRWHVWGSAYGGSEEIGGDPVVGSHDTDADTFGMIGGIVRNWGDTSLGVALGGGSSNFSLSDGLGSGQANSFNSGIFGRHGFGDAYIAGAVAYGFHDTETSRVVLGDSLSAEFNAQTFAGRVEGGYRFDTPVAALTPYAAFQAIAYRLPAYSETSANSGVFALDYEADTTTATRAELGLDLDRTIMLDDDNSLTLSGRAAWVINGGTERRVTSTFQSLPGATFTIDGAAPDRNSLLVDAAAEYRNRSGFFASLGFEGEFSGNVQSYSGKAKLGLSW